MIPGYLLFGLYGYMATYHPWVSAFWTIWLHIISGYTYICLWTIHIIPGCIYICFWTTWLYTCNYISSLGARISAFLLHCYMATYHPWMYLYSLFEYKAIRLHVHIILGYLLLDYMGSTYYHLVHVYLLMDYMTT